MRWSRCRPRHHNPVAPGTTRMTHETTGRCTLMKMLRRWANLTGVRATAVGLVLAGVLCACGGHEGEKGGVEAAERLLPDPLPAAAASPLFGAQLPKGAVPEATVESATEAFKVAPPVTLSEVNAFYQREMDNKPFGEFTWCGSELDEMAKSVTRSWRRTGTSDYRTVLLRSVTVKEPTLIVVSQRTGTLPGSCR